MQLLILIISFVQVVFSQLAWQKEMLDLVNNLRQSKGVSPLCFNSKLNTASMNFAKVLASQPQINSNSHKADGLPNERMIRAGFKP